MGEFTTLSGVRPQTVNRPAMPIVDRTLVTPRVRCSAPIAAQPRAVMALPELPPIEQPRITPEGFIPPKPVRPGEMIGGRRIGEGEVVFSIADMIRVAVEATGMPKAHLLSTRRQSRVVKARQIGMWLAKHYTGRSLPLTGQAFGGRDHTTVLHAVRRVEHAIVANRITVAADPVEVARELWSVDWPRVPK